MRERINKIVGEKTAKVLVLFPIKYLSSGTCVTLIMIGGVTMKTFFHTMCNEACTKNPPTTTHWYLVFTCVAILLAQFPNLNSLARVSLVGAITAIGYCVLICVVVSIVKGRSTHASYEPQSGATRIFGVWNALGIIAFAFRGHNLVLEIQIPSNGGILGDLNEHDTTKSVLIWTSLLVVINCLSSFQIYAMPVFDNLESMYRSKKSRLCPWWLRMGFGGLFGCLTFFVAVVLPFLPSLAGLIGGIAIPITLAYPCFMWMKLKKPKIYSTNRYLNWVLGTCSVLELPGRNSVWLQCSKDPPSDAYCSRLSFPADGIPVEDTPTPK